MVFTIILSEEYRDGMLADTTSAGVPGKAKNETIHIAKVELSNSWPQGEQQNSWDGCLYKSVLATTSEGARFVWKDETEADHVQNHARQYGTGDNNNGRQCLESVKPLKKIIHTATNNLNFSSLTC